MAATQFGVGLVGTGIMGRRMMASLQRHPRFRIQALWDPQADALREGCALAGGARAAAGLEDLVADPAVDLVYIASPPAQHLAGVRAALSARRACLCEKPLASDLASAQALQRVVAESGLPFAVNFPFARADAACGLLEQVRSGALGELQSATLTLRFAQWPRPWQSGASSWLAGPTEGGFTREVASHFVFLALRLFGPARVESVRLQRAPGQSETALQATLVHAALRLTIDAAVGGDIADANRFEVVGSAGRAALSGWSRLEHAGAVAAPGEPRESGAATLDAVAAMLDGRSDHGLARVDEALAVVKIVETLVRC